MKVLLLVSCLLSPALAGWFSHADHHHVPVIHDGVPVDTPEVQHAKAEHFAAVAEAKAKASHGDFSGHDYEFLGHDNHDSHDVFVHHDAHENHDVGYSVHHDGHYGYHGPPAYETTHVKPEIGHDGKPLDTPEVQIAKAHHEAAFHEALHRSPPHDLHHRRRRGIEDYHQSHEFSYHHIHAPVYGHHYDHHDHPGVDHKGQPLDTAEVEYLKLKHLAAHQEAKILNELAKHDHNAINHNYGGPQDTPEVQHAKAEHFAAHAKASIQQHHY